MLGWFKKDWILSSRMNCSRRFSYIIFRFSIIFIARINPVLTSFTRKTLPNLPSPNFENIRKFSLLSVVLAVETLLLSYSGLIEANFFDGLPRTKGGTILLRIFKFSADWVDAVSFKKLFFDVTLSRWLFSFAKGLEIGYFSLSVSWLFLPVFWELLDGVLTKYSSSIRIWGGF